MLDDEGLSAELARYVEATLVQDQGRLERLASRSRELYHPTVELFERTPTETKIFAKFPEVFEELFVQEFDDQFLSDVAATLDARPEYVETRRRQARIYRRLLSDPQITHPAPLREPVTGTVFHCPLLSYGIT